VQRQGIEGEYTHSTNSILATIQSSSYFESEMAKLRHEVEDYAKQFPTIGFDKATMKYNK